MYIFDLSSNWITSQDAPSLPQVSNTAPPSTQTPVTPSLMDPHLWAVVDPDIARENSVEDKHRRLVRSHRSSPYDRELKPNAKIRDELGVSYIH
jgi:phosphatidylinositol 3-kinase